MELFKTNSLDHYHIVYVPEQFSPEVEVMTSFDSGHAHAVYPHPELGTPVIGAAGDPESPHVHEMILLEPKKKFVPVLEREDENDTVSDVIQLYKVAKDWERISREKAVESLEMYEGDQWDDAIRADLEESGRACVTVNRYEAIIDALSGYFRQNRTDFRYYAIEDGDSGVADILTIAAKQVSSQSNLEVEETRVFEDMAILGRGVFHFYIDHDIDARGAIRIEHFPSLDAFFGPHQKLDGSDCDYALKTSWVSFNYIKQMYPEMSNTIDQVFDPDVYIGDEGEDVNNPNDISTPSSVPAGDLIDFAKKQVRLFECERKTFFPEAVVIEEGTGKQLIFPDMSKSVQKKIKTIQGIQLIPRTNHIIRVTKLAGKVLLDDEYTKRPFKGFSIMPSYAKKHNHYWWGKLENLKDLQREINKRHSQAIDMANRVNGSGWFIDGTTFDGAPEGEEKFTRISSKPGFVCKIADVNRPPARVEGPGIPAEIPQMMTMANAELQDVSGVISDISNAVSRDASAAAITTRQQQSLIVNKFLYDNFQYTKRLIGRRIVETFQGLYEVDRLMRLVGSAIAQDPSLQINNQDPNAEVLADIRKILETEDLLQYDVEVGEGDLSPTAKSAAFEQWSNAAKSGVMVPPELLVELSNLPFKKKVLLQMRAMQQQQQQLEQAKIEAEVVKSAMGGAKKPGTGVAK